MIHRLDEVVSKNGKRDKKGREVVYRLIEGVLQ